MAETAVFLDQEGGGSATDLEVQHWTNYTCAKVNCPYADVYVNISTQQLWLPEALQDATTECCGVTVLSEEYLKQGDSYFEAILLDFTAGLPYLDLVTLPVTLMFFQFSFVHYIATLVLPAATFVAVVGLDLYKFADVTEVSPLSPLYMLVVGIFVYTSCVLSVRSYTRLQRAQFSLYHALKIRSAEFRHDVAQRGYRVALEANRTLLGNSAEEFGKMAHSVKTTTI